jgi:hypothetical protein
MTHVLCHVMIGEPLDVEKRFDLREVRLGEADLGSEDIVFGVIEVIPELRLTQSRYAPGSEIADHERVADLRAARNETAFLDQRRAAAAK